jgi:hypothetical protein
MSDTIQSAIDECDMCDWGQDGRCHEVKRNCPRKKIQSAATNNIGGFLDSLVDLISEDAGQDEWIKAGELLEARDAAIRADEARKQAERYAWISVKDRLPETAEHVLLCNKSGSVFVGFYYDKEWTDLKLGLRDPTHWMPLPNPFLADLEAPK